MERKLIIVGLDPGTTIGYSILDLTGRIIEAKSIKNIDLGRLISRIIQSGNPLAVGCDKKHVPALVERFSIKVGARLITPDHDLLVKEKREIIGNAKTNDAHQLDSLASAFYAYSKLRSVLRKIKFFIEKNKKEKIANEIYKLVIKNRLSIHYAVDLIETPENRETGRIRRAIEKKIFSHDDFMKIYSKLRESEERESILLTKNREIKNSLINAEKTNSELIKRLNKKYTKERSDMAMKIKEKNIKTLSGDWSELKRNTRSIIWERSKLEQFMLEIKEYYVLKRLDNFGSDFEKNNSILKIKQGDIIIVDHPEIISMKTLDIISEKIDVIIGRNQFPKKFREDYNFIMIDANKLNITDFKHFSLVRRKEFDRMMDKHELLKKIVHDYRKKRK